MSGKLFMGSSGIDIAGFRIIIYFMMLVSDRVCLGFFLRLVSVIEFASFWCFNLRLSG